MAVKTVIDNLKTKGLKETQRIRLCKKYNLVKEEVHLKKLQRCTTEKERYKNIAFGYEFNLKDDDKMSGIYKKITAAFTMRQLLAEIEDEEGSKTIDELIGEMLSSSADKITAEELSAWDEKMKGLETKQYKVALKRMFIKRLIPETYNKYRDSELDEKKILFLQPRTGLNQTFKYIYRKMEKDGVYEPELVELRRGEVSHTEHFINALSFFKEAADAKAIMVHESSEYFGYVDIRKETKLVQLWHGCGIIKYLGLDCAGMPGFKSEKGYIEFPEYNKYDIVTIASEGQRPVFERFMGKEAGDPVIQAIGVSRTDEFFDPEYIENCYSKLYKIVPEAKEKKTILYAPTYRGKDPIREAPNRLDIAKFAEKLSDDYVLLIKHHQTSQNIPEIPEEYRDKFAYDVTRGRGMDINELMTVADICISDYSSVVFEYSVFERPIIFYMYDLEDYSDSRGMYYSYEELAECGPIFKTNEEMIDYIADIDNAFDKERVVEFKNKFMSACDGHATERIINFIEDGQKQ